MEKRGGQAGIPLLPAARAAGATGRGPWTGPRIVNGLEACRLEQADIPAALGLLARRAELQVRYGLTRRLLKRWAGADAASALAYAKQRLLVRDGG
ncbi:MAG: hypothetical protein ACLQVX_11870 [Limisphaerales bacterium]